MTRLISLAAFVALSGMLAPACGAPVRTPDPGDKAAGQARGKAPGEIATTQSQKPSERFRNLDEYLAFLERTQAPVDGAWYREVRPDVFVLQTGNLRILGDAPRAREFTRAELEKKFGFTK